MPAGRRNARCALPPLLSLNSQRALNKSYCLSASVFFLLGFLLYYVSRACSMHLRRASSRLNCEPPAARCTRPAVCPAAPR